MGRERKRESVPLRFLFSLLHQIDHVIWPRTISNTSIIVDCINQRINAIKNQSSDQSNKLLGIIVSFGRFLPASLLSLFNYGCYNIHPSLLPRWKGPTPLLYTLLSRDKVTGITLFRLDPTHTTFDSGSVVYQQSIRLPHNKSIFLTPEQLVVYLIPHSIKAMFEVNFLLLLLFHLCKTMFVICLYHFSPF
ncbi:unnamed protein product [Trichobilharzia regenti]|nr:unnamed protein product [Trichobilharzia regenti]